MTREEEVALRLIRGAVADLGLTGCHVAICTPCLDGVGGECHTPGCLFWMCSALDIPIRERAMDSDGYHIAAALLTARQEGVAEGERKERERAGAYFRSLVESPACRETVALLSDTYRTVAVVLEGGHYGRHTPGSVDEGQEWPT